VFAFDNPIPEDMEKTLLLNGLGGGEKDEFYKFKINFVNNMTVKI